MIFYKQCFFNGSDIAIVLNEKKRVSIVSITIKWYTLIGNSHGYIYIRTYLILPIIGKLVNLNRIGPYMVHENRGSRSTY